MYRGHFYPKNIKNPRLSLSSGSELRQRSRKKHTRRNSQLVILNTQSLNQSIRMPSPKQNYFLNQKIEYHSNPILMIKGYQKLANPIQPYFKSYTNFIRTPSAKRNKIHKKIVYSQKDCANTEENVLTDCCEQVFNRPLTSNSIKNKYLRNFNRQNHSFHKKKQILPLRDSQQDNVRGWEFAVDEQIDFN